MFKFLLLLVLPIASEAAIKKVTQFMLRPSGRQDESGIPINPPYEAEIKESYCAGDYMLLCVVFTRENHPTSIHLFVDEDSSPDSSLQVLSDGTSKYDKPENWIEAKALVTIIDVGCSMQRLQYAMQSNMKPKASLVLDDYCQSDIQEIHIDGDQVEGKTTDGWEYCNNKVCEKKDNPMLSKPNTWEKKRIEDD